MGGTTDRAGLPRDQLFPGNDSCLGIIESSLLFYVMMIGLIIGIPGAKVPFPGLLGILSLFFPFLQIILNNIIV